MNGIDLVLRDIAKTQRSEETLVRRCPEILPESIPTQTPPFYSSAFDRPTSEPCVCGKQSGTLNKIQEDWIKIQLKLIEDGMRPPIRIDPPVPMWSKRPDLNAYLLKPLFVIDPERQYGVNVTAGACLSCNKVGFLFRKQFSSPRIIDCIDTTGFALYARYVCKKSKSSGGCGATFHVMDGAKTEKLIPTPIVLNYPVQLFEQSAHDVGLVQMSYDLYTSRSGSADVARHCNGYNGTLGPVESTLTGLVNDCIARQLPFFNRMEGAITGTHLSADHHHNVPGRMKLTDEFNGRKFAPVAGLHSVMNERQQILSHQFTSTTGNAEPSSTVITTAEEPAMANTCVVSEIVLRPPFMVDHQLPGLDQILAASIPAPSAGEPFSQVEKELLNYLLTSPAERSHVKSATGDQTSWKSLAKRFLYWARVARVLGMNQFRARSDGQLKQKVKDDNKKKSC
ncbi:hypothetical protein KSP39_PZI011866 [Platanthera zijinensis]|uniref:Uncharacterized protein n=1 Tax=Platanthera zijinensis TaxID=2320716 RepID=A0AAP0BEI0_9ASPA